MNKDLSSMGNGQLTEDGEDTNFYGRIQSLNIDKQGNAKASFVQSNQRAFQHKADPNASEPNGSQGNATLHIKNAHLNASPEMHQLINKKFGHEYMQQSEDELKLFHEQCRKILNLSIEAQKLARSTRNYSIKERLKRLNIEQKLRRREKATRESFEFRKRGRADLIRFAPFDARAFDRAELAVDSYNPKRLFLGARKYSPVSFDNDRVSSSSDFELSRTASPRQNQYDV